MSKGDFVQVLVDVGAGRIERFTVTASGDGRKVEVVEGPRATQVRELSRSGETVRTARFRNDRIVALDEQQGLEVKRKGKRKDEVGTEQLPGLEVAE